MSASDKKAVQHFGIAIIGSVVLVVVFTLVIGGHAIYSWANSYFSL